jgi:hypothetical protein
MDRRNSKSENNWGTSRVRNTVGGRRAAIRVLTDNFTGMVVVYEQEPAPGEAGPRRLVFESSMVIIKVDAYPEHWRRMGDEALLALRYPHS